jgi:hypothetical protein
MIKILFLHYITDQILGKNKNPRKISDKFAAGLGLGPRLPGPKPGVLPLHHPAIWTLLYPILSFFSNSERSLLLQLQEEDEVLESI